MRCRVGLAAMGLLSAPIPLFSQDTLTVAGTLPGWALNLGIGRVGLSLGNASVWNGIRINFSDRAVREVNGVNEVSGLSVAGLAVVGSEGVAGIAATLGGIESTSLVRGLVVAGYRIKSPDVRGFVIPVAWLRAGELRGVSISAYNRIVGEQRGLAIGVVNYARRPAWRGQDRGEQPWPGPHPAPGQRTPELTQLH